MDGEKSRFAPVCNFQRQVSGIAMIAPEAARARAARKPATAAISPHMALPMVSAPNITVTYIARPRPRTHSGRATCAETLRLDTAAIHDAPAMRLAATAVTMSPARANNAVAIELARVAAASSRSAPNFASEPSQQERTAHRRDPNGAEQYAVKCRAAGDLFARDERQQCPVGTGENEESDGPNQSGTEMRIVSCVPKAGAHGVAERFGCQSRAAFSRRTPPHKSGDNSKIAKRVEPERQGDSEGSHEDSAERRTDGTADIDAHTVRRNRRGQIALSARAD